jgi:hypothetical protein
MPGKNNSTSATLDIRDTASNGDGWTNVKASNGATYSYQYTGGNQRANNGSILNAVGGGHAATTLGFAKTADARYEFANISFTGDDARQLSADGNASQTREIHDQCTAVIDAQYHVLVRDTEVGATIPCDPMIKNQ